MQTAVFLIILIAGISTIPAYSQEVGLSTFQETVQIIIDKSITQNVTASITLQSTSIQEITIPASLEQQIREDQRIASIVFTNQDTCVLGVVNESCIMINVLSNPDNKGIFEVQNYTRNTAELYIDEINRTFDTDASFHSIFIHTADESNQALGTSGIIYGRGIVSAVYTLPMSDTHSMYEKISSMLIPTVIREKGGFYNIAKELSSNEHAKMVFSIIPSETKSLLQLKLSLDYPNQAPTVSEISPLEFLKVDNIKRSNYFDSGFYPLNSIIQIIILSSESTTVSDVNASIIPTQVIDGEKIPTDISQDGWIFDPQEGQVIQGKYIFGEESEASKDKLKFSLGQENPPPAEFDESILVVIAITIISISAAIFYLKGYRK